MPPKKAASAAAKKKTATTSSALSAGESGESAANKGRKRKAAQSQDTPEAIDLLQPFREELEHSKDSREYFREIYLKTITDLQNELKKDKATKDVRFIREKFLKLKENKEKVERCDEQIMLLMMKCRAPRQQLNEETQAIDAMHDQWVNVKVSVDILLSPEHGESEVRSVESKKKAIKFEKVKLKEFNGEYLQWLPFWSQYKPFHDDNDVDDATKFTFLSQHIAEGNRARDLVDSFSQHTAENYPKLIEALQERFGDPQMLQQVYVQELMNMVLEKGKKESSIGIIYDKLQCHIGQLETLGVPSNQFSLFLYPMVQAAFPEEVVKGWQKSSLYGKDGSTLDPPQTDLSMFMNYVKKEVKDLQHRTLNTDGFKSQVDRQHRFSSFKKARLDEETMPTAAGLHSSRNQTLYDKCCFCGLTNHLPSACFRAKGMSFEDRQKKVKECRLCFICLIKGHIARRCNNNRVKCTICGERHYAPMCKQNAGQNNKAKFALAKGGGAKNGNGSEKARESSSNVEVKKETSNQASTSSSSAQLSSHRCRDDVLLDVEIVRVFGTDGREKVVRLFYDKGAQSSCILKGTVEQMSCVKVGEEFLYTAVFGGVTTDLRSHNKYSVKVSSYDYKVEKMLTLLDEDDITGILPRIPCHENLRQELNERGITPSDFNNRSPSDEIEILIGADLYPHLITGKVVKLDCGLVATETVFGWTLSGPVSLNKEEKAHTRQQTVRLTYLEEKAPDPLQTAMLSTFHIPSLWALDVIGITDPVEHRSKKEHDEIVQNNVMQTIKRKEDGRYSVSLPWVAEKVVLPDNYIAAKAILESVSNSKLHSPALFHLVDKVVKMWLDNDYIELVEVSNKFESVHYLPHHPVFKPASKTTPVRPVFNASYRLGRNPSLNMLLETGSNLLELIPSILLRFREKRVAAVADIKQAFLQIEIDEADRNYLRFLWWESESRDKILIYRHKRVVFGVTCSPFLLMIVIYFHLSHVDPKYRGLAMKLWECLYVDNAATSFDNKEEYLEFKQVSTDIMNEGKLELRLWESNVDEQGDGESSDVSVLGLKWNKRDDTLNCNICTSPLPQFITKRILASEVQKSFDPCGFLAPALLIPKLMLRQAWQEGKRWNDDISDTLKEKYKAWRSEMHYLAQIKVPRHIQINNASGLQIHTFCDTCIYAYGAVVYLRSESERRVVVRLLLAKVRVSPLKNISIPRLELLACLIGQRLTVAVKESLKYETIPTIYWSDSSNALAWIRRNDRWGTYVGNRVKEILQNSHPDEWRYVPTNLNPADLLSRGCTPSKLLAESWHDGPSWLSKSSNDWPHALPVASESIVNAERKKLTVAQNVAIDDDHWYLPFHSYWKNVTTMSYVLKWKGLLKRKRFRGNTIPLPTDDAEMVMCKLVQAETFPEVVKVIKGILVQKDEKGIYRIQTKLINKTDTEFFRRPILLPANHKFTIQLIHWYHHCHGHAGVSTLLSTIRERYWIFQGKRMVKRVIRACIVCKKLRAKAPIPPSPALPADRVQMLRPFSTIGIDLGGPLLLRDGTKVWFVLFTCCVFRCVSLELCPSLSTKTFLLALSRFISRRGRPNLAYSDNGSNLRGGVNLFSELNWTFIEETTRAKRIKWRFIPPASPWFGGFYEKLIGLVKDLLKRMLGNCRLGYVELETVLLEVESIVNARPLTYIGEDSDELIPLTPSMFIQPIPDSEFPEGELISTDDFNAQYRNLGILRQELEHRFRSEYLGLLVQASKQTRGHNLKVGDVVLVEIENRKRQLWPMGRITELIKGQDGTVRIAQVQLPHQYELQRDENGKMRLEKVQVGSSLLRPIRKLFPLEVAKNITTLPITKETQDAAERQKIDEMQGYVTRFGRRVIKPERLQV